MDMNDCEHSTDAGAWVLGALDEPEAARYGQHLRECARCRDEVASLRAAAVALPLATEQVAPPPELKSRIMRVVESEAQLLRASGPDADRVHPPRPRRRRRLLAPFSLRGLPAAGLAAVMLAVGVAGGVLLSGDSSPQTRTVEGNVATAGGRAIVRITDGRAKLEVMGLRNPARGRVYQVWLKRAGHAPEPTAALFVPSRDGAATASVPGSMEGIDQVMVTDEPDGGSPQPTGKLLAVADLS
jgi:anti-sigma-K factor RskA